LLKADFLLFCLERDNCHNNHEHEHDCTNDAPGNDRGILEELLNALEEALRCVSTVIATTSVISATSIVATSVISATSAIVANVTACNLLYVVQRDVGVSIVDNVYDLLTGVCFTLLSNAIGNKVLVRDVTGYVPLPQSSGICGKERAVNITLLSLNTSAIWVLVWVLSRAIAVDVLFRFFEQAIGAAVPTFVSTRVCPRSTSCRVVTGAGKYMAL
jgi:hypothetical protein